MKKTVIIIILAVVSAASLLFAYSQKIKADKFEFMASVAQKTAEQQKVFAESAAIVANQQTMIAQAQTVMAMECEQKLRNCKDGK